MNCPMPAPAKPARPKRSQANQFPKTLAPSNVTRFTNIQKHRGLSQKVEQASEQRLFYLHELCGIKRTRKSMIIGPKNSQATHKHDGFMNTHLESTGSPGII